LRGIQNPEWKTKWLVFILLSFGFSQPPFTLYPEGYLITNSFEPVQPRETVTKATAVSTFKKIKPDFLVNSGCGDHGSNQLNINIARDEDGYYLCVWIEERTGQRELNAQLFNSLDERIGSLIQVSDNYTHWNSQPAIVYNAVSHEYLISWAEPNWIKLQRITQSGTRIGSNITISQHQRTNTDNPTAVVGPSGQVLVTWLGDYSTILNIKAYCRLFSADLTPLGNEHQLVQSSYQNISSLGWDLRAASDTSGHFVITWSAHRNNRSRIVIQVVDRNGELEGPNLEVSDSTDNSGGVFPTIASTDDGHYLVLWSASSKIMGRIFNIDSGFVAPPFSVNEESASWYTYSVNSDRQNTFYILFTGSGPTGQMVTKQGEFLGSNIPLAISAPISYLVYPKLTRVQNGTLYAAFYGYHDNDLDVVVQKFDSDFNILSDAFKVANDSCSSWQTNPLVKYNQFGQSMIVWEDRRNGRVDLYGRMYDEENNPVTFDFLIDTTDHYLTSPLNIVPDRDGNFIVAYRFGDYAGNNIRIRKIAPSGTLIGAYKTVTDYHSANPRGAIAVNDSGDVMLAWMANTRYSSGYLQKFDRDLNPRSPIIEFLKGYSPNYKKILSISVNSRFDVFAVWLDYDPGHSETGKILKGQWFTPEGVASSEVMHIDSLDGQREYGTAVCQVNNDSSLICVWNDYNRYGYNSRLTIWRSYKNCSETVYRDTYPLTDYFSTPQIVEYGHRKTVIAWNDGKNIYSVLLDDNSLINKMVRLHTFDPYYFSRPPFNSYDVSLFEDQLQISYESVPVPEKGYDIYANVQRIEGFDFDSVACYPKDNGLANAAVNFFEIVYPPFPNPANDHLTIWYELIYKSPVTISVYNLMGQELSRIDYGYRPAGLYYETINTGSLSTGLYFIHFQGRGAITMKFLILH